MKPGFEIAFFLVYEVRVTRRYETALIAFSFNTERWISSTSLKFFLASLRVSPPSYNLTQMSGISHRLSSP